MSEKLINQRRVVVYRNYSICLCFDGTFDILIDNELVDGDYKTIDDAKKYIDQLTRQDNNKGG